MSRYNYSRQLDPPAPFVYVAVSRAENAAPGPLSDRS